MSHSARKMVVLAVAGMVAADVGFVAARQHGAATAAAPVVAAEPGDSRSGAGVGPAPADAALVLPTTTAPVIPPTTTPPITTVVRRTAPRVAAAPVQQSATASPAVAPPPEPWQPPTKSPAPNNPPVLPPHEWHFTIRRDQTLTIQDDRLIREASDPDGEPVYFVLVSFEGGGTGSNDRYGHITFSPNGPGTTELRFQVQDEAGARSDNVNRIVITVS